jgi:PPM family protein phosphatase
MKVQSCGITDIGRKRQKNEDSYLVNDHVHLYIVADGMGGHVGGEFASKIAVSTVEEIVKGVDKNEAYRQSYLYFESEGGKPNEITLREAISKAGSKICQKAIEEPELKGMGTTATVLLIDSGKALIAHVGDSRAYCVRNAQIRQLTEDHSLVNEQVKSGLITEAEAKTHQLKNIITRSVGVQEEVEIDTVIAEVAKDDVYVLCSDGLSNLVDDQEIANAVNENAKDPEGAARTLVDLANQRGGDDNITLILVRILD